MRSTETHMARRLCRPSITSAVLFAVAGLCSEFSPAAAQAGSARQAAPIGATEQSSPASQASSPAPGAAAISGSRRAPLPPEQRAALLTSLRQAHPGTHFSEVVITQVPDLYEVWMNDTVAYVSARNPRFFVFGRLFDTQAMRDLTGPRLAQRAASTAPVGAVRSVADNESARSADWRSGASGTASVGTASASVETGQTGAPIAARHARGSFAFDQLPFTDAIRTVRGSGERHLAVFSDPGCIYCKRLESELGGLDNVTIHTFLVPFQGSARPIAIWCAMDRGRAWRQWMLHGDATDLEVAAPCDHPISRNLALARQWEVHGTPTLIWADGSRTDGFAPREHLEARLIAATSSTPVSPRRPSLTARPPQPAADQQTEGQP